MSKSHTKETTEFNNYISYIGNFKKFSADKIHRDEEVKALFEYYMLKSGKDLFTPKIFGQRVLAYWKKLYPTNDFILYNNNTDISKNSRTAYRVEELFKIDNFNLAMTISDKKYRSLGSPNKILDPLIKRARDFQDNLDGKVRVEKTELEKIQENPERYKLFFINGMLRQKINEWHEYCIAINQAEIFIKQRYERFEKNKQTILEKDKMNDELIILSQQLRAFYTNVWTCIVLEDFANTTFTDGIFKKLKIKKLLDLQLPQIDTQAIAKKMTENLLPPYNQNSTPDKKSNS